jgi:hypothetical protein
MAKDIEEFLKMAAQRRRESASNAPASQPPPAQSRPPVKQQQKKPSKPPILVGDDDAETISQRRESVAKHVQKHLDTSRLKKHAEKLGEEVGRADDKIEARLHEKFDHQIGQLTGKEIASADSPRKSKASGTPKLSLLKMLAAPENIQQAIIMSEILKRPEWD